ncbi:hypothetical protein SAMN04489806_0784 [Paramicrobacterium humi]|uniref:Uncharacterized protein n=1 Tax=Paramicrobacterium humi TaxID=640635 RepID=A0A1H4JNL1_9MICO|nr:hypothetical protein [Microbacterium humi]SEB47747.1 hypothetical protein SAMN04489806_0784 [Microbacterium humi]
MTRDLDPAGESSTEARLRRVFRIRMWAGAACYLLASLALSLWGPQNGGDPWRAVWVVLPLLPVAWMVLVVILRVRSMDEYQVKLLVPGLAVGFTVAIVTALVLGTLDIAGIHTPNGGWSVCFAGIAAWLITNAFTGAPDA